jgi:dTDP-D-glucose 4,6-dehydratase
VCWRSPARLRGSSTARRRPDISRAKALLGWEPKVGLQEGLEATAAWFSDEQNRSVFFGTPDKAREDLVVSIAAE